MKKNKRFSVTVIGFNADTFAINYDGYIISESDYDSFGTKLFEMNAPKSVYNEIKNLSEEFIDII